MGGKDANDWGLCDMHGNVWEWCADWYAKDYYQKRVNKDPKGPDSGGARVVRGGAWSSTPVLCRAAYRNWNAPGSCYDYFGLRVCFRLD